MVSLLIERSSFFYNEMLDPISYEESSDFSLYSLDFFGAALDSYSSINSPRSIASPFDLNSELTLLYKDDFEKRVETMIFSIIDDVDNEEITEIDYQFLQEEQVHLNMPKSPTPTYKKTDVLYKTEQCRNFSQKGYCNYGFKCRFAHAEPLRERIHHPKFQTIHCINFSKNGSCRYENRCHFIHEKPEKEGL